MEDKNIAIAIILFGLVMVMIFFGFYTINAGYRGVILTFGKPTMESVNEGFHLKIPFAQKVIKMDVKTQKYEADLSAASKDLQDVSTKIAINYHILPERVPEIYRDIGIDYAEKIIYPYEQETNKGITSQFTAEELITKREAVREKMKVDLADKLRDRGIVVEEVSIVNFAFSTSFTQAIEAKVTAEQNALAAKNKLEQVKYEAEQRITYAKGEAESLRLQRQEVTPDLVRLRQIEMMMKAIEKWNGIMPLATSGMPFLDLSSQQQSYIDYSSVPGGTVVNNKS